METPTATEILTLYVKNISNLIWVGTWDGEQILPVGPIAVILLGVGLWFMIRLSGRPLRRFFPAIGEVWRGRKGSGDTNAITPWQALSTALSGQVGTGNLAGVATAITLGGPGAIFWMWITALFGMALAFAESSLAVKFRQTDTHGRIHGGPMYYIKNGLGKKWMWLAVLFCICAIFSAMVTGGMIQVNSITKTALKDIEHYADVAVPAWIIGLILAALTFAVIIGGIKSIGSVAGRLVPFMAGLYVLVAFVVLLLNAAHIPAAFMMIINSAFGFEQAVGGAAGYGMLYAMRAGIARGLFSNEAGQGSAPIAHAATQEKNPVKQGEIAMIGVFIDTLVICTMTALVILTATGTWVDASGAQTLHVWQAADLEGSTVTNEAFSKAFPHGGLFVTVCLALFAFTTIIGWSYYAEQAITFICGDRVIRPFRCVWVGVIFVGCLLEVEFVWLFGDIANAAMAFPNLIAIAALTGVVIAMHKKNGDPDTHDGNSVMLGPDGKPGPCGKPEPG